MMEPTDLNKLRRDLMKRFVSGELDMATCQRKLGELAADELDCASSASGFSGESHSSEMPDSSSLFGCASSIGPFGSGSNPFLAEASEQGNLSPCVNLGGFVLESLIGRGGMGEVWRAYDPTADRWVVVKVVPPEAQQNPEEMETVKEVFRRVQGLQHQHICPLLVLGESPLCGYFVVMKYIDGQTLAAYRRRFADENGGLSVPEVVRLLRPVAAALDYAHSRGVIHRDIKPANVLVAEDGRDVQVIDLGLAAEIRTSVSRVSRVQMDSSGTPAYMAPEQWRGQYQDAKTDQYSLGVLAYELISGHLPFQVYDISQLRLCVLHEPTPPLDGQSDLLNATLARAMAKKRDDRHATCMDFVEALNTSALTIEVAHDIDRMQQRMLRGATPGSYVQEAYETRLDLWQAAAGARISDAMWLVGCCHEHGRGVVQDYGIAARWYRDAAFCGSVWAQYDWGRACYHGRGVKEDRAEAWRWYREAALHGNVLAQFDLGDRYRTGRGVAKDSAKAVEWYRLAAEQGHVPAQYALGRAYHYGEGIPKDIGEAVKWYELAADQEHVRSKYALGHIAFLEQGVSPEWRLFRAIFHSDWTDVVDHLEEMSGEELSLPWLTELSVEMAAKLASHQGVLELNGLEEVPAKLAAALARHKGELRLNGLDELPAKTAAALAAHTGSLYLDGVVELSPRAAATLAQHKGFELSLNGLTELSPEVAAALAQHKRFGLSLNGLTELSPEAAAAIATHDSDLSLNGLTELSPEVTTALAEHKGGLSLNGLTELSPEAVVALAGSENGLSLDGLTELSPEAAAALAAHKGALSLDGLTELSPEAAAAIATHDCHLSLDGLTELSPEVTTALAEHKGGLALNGLTELSLEVVAALAQHKGFELSLNGLAELSPEVASALATHQGGLSLVGLTELSDEARKALENHAGKVKLLC